MDRRGDDAHNLARGACMNTFALAALIAALPAMALAQHPALPQSVPPGFARAEGEALLAQAKAGDLFDDLTGTDAQDIKLRHKASGLICVFNAGEAANKLVVFDAPVRGDDIACVTGGEAGERTLYASHTPGRKLEDAFAKDVAAVKTSHPDWAEYKLPDGTDSPVLAMLNIPPMPPSKTARFIADHQFTSVSSAVVKDWSLTFRFTCAEEQADPAAGSWQPTLWVSILSQISGASMDLIQPKQAI